MKRELEIEATTLTAIAEAIEKSENDPTCYVIALHGMVSRLYELAEQMPG